ncbi:hypothetical protein M5K25_004157 [Dendrobium thyrsiflorum]|uniref:Uncharacterized protein n=1 Tax=Dendrobium thyrsiflorum TaxID=117978 RepID=A0ABD0VKV2_DENTH
MSIERDLISAVHSNHSEITPDLSLIYEPCHSQKSINRALISPRRGTQGKKGRRRREEKKERREETPPRPPPDSQVTPKLCPTSNFLYLQQTLVESFTTGPGPVVFPLLRVFHVKNSSVLLFLFVCAEYPYNAETNDSNFIAAYILARNSLAPSVGISYSTTSSIATMVNRRSNRIVGASRSNSHQSRNQSMNHRQPISAYFYPGGQNAAGEGTSGPSLEERIRKMEESHNEILQLLRETRQPALPQQE